MTGQDELNRLWQESAAPHGVSPEVHPNDLLWSFVASHPAFPTLPAAAHYYFDDGAESARKLADLIARHAAPGAGQRLRLLEFASGYGMVTRHLPRALPDVDIVSCDIHPAAVSFVRDSLGVPAVLSTHQPEHLDLAGGFDVVFALSFFSHMPAASFGRWLAALYAQVRPGGVLAFTTHGRSSLPALGEPELSEDGFWFMPSSEQEDLEGAEYGSTISLTEYVVAALYGHVRAPIAEFRGGYWWQHQDLYVVAKPAKPAKALAERSWRRFRTGR